MRSLPIKKNRYMRNILFRNNFPTDDYTIYTYEKWFGILDIWYFEELKKKLYKVSEIMRNFPFNCISVILGTEEKWLDFHPIRRLWKALNINEPIFEQTLIFQIFCVNIAVNCNISLIQTLFKSSVFLKGCWVCFIFQERNIHYSPENKNQIHANFKQFTRKWLSPHGISKALMLFSK